MTVCPTSTLVARPVPSMVAVPGVSDCHDACVVRSCTDPSVYEPVAVNCRFVPFGMLGLTGVTEMLTKVALVTVSVTMPATALLYVAVMLVDPSARPLARPRAEPPVVTLPMVPSDDCQTDELV